MENAHDDMARDPVEAEAWETVKRIQAGLERTPTLEREVLAKKMTRRQFQDFHVKLCSEAFELMKRKNADYGGESDPFANFRMSALLNLEPEQGVLLRMQDKMARITSFLRKGDLAVKEESWRDACVDLVNYSIILCGLLTEQSNSKE